MIESGFLRTISRGGYSFAANLNTGKTMVGRGSVSTLGTPAKVYGKWGGAATLNGSSDGFVLPSFNLGPGSSFGIRFKLTSSTASMTLLDFSQSSGAGTLVYMRVNEGGTGKVNIAGIFPFFNAVSSTSTSNDGAWHSAIGVWGPGGTMTLYYDCVSVASVAATVGKFLVLDPRAGVEYWFGTNYSWLNGTVADPFMCNTVLTQQEVRAYHVGTIEQGEEYLGYGISVVSGGDVLPRGMSAIRHGETASPWGLQPISEGVTA